MNKLTNELFYKLLLTKRFKFNIYIINIIKYTNIVYQYIITIHIFVYQNFLSKIADLQTN